MIKNKIQEEECEKTKSRHDFSEEIEEIFQWNWSQYKIMLHIFSKRKKIIHQKYITLNDEYVFSEFYIQARQLQEKLWKYDFNQHLKRQLMKESTIYDQLWQKNKKFMWSLTSKNDQLSQQD